MTAHQFYVVIDQEPNSTELQAMGPLADPRLGTTLLEPDRPEPELLDAVLCSVADVERSGRVVKRIVEGAEERRPLITAADLVLQLRTVAESMPGEDLTRLYGLLRNEAPRPRSDSTVRPPRSSGRIGPCIAA